MLNCILHFFFKTIPYNEKRNETFQFTSTCINRQFDCIYNKQILYFNTLILGTQKRIDETELTTKQSCS